METREDIVSELKKLLTSNYDAEYCYKEAVQEVDNPRLKTFFKTYVEQRYRFGHDLKGEIMNLGADPEDAKGTSVMGDIHRSWMKFKTAIAGNKKEEILDECRRQEMSTWESYNEALGLEDLPPTTRKLLKDHKEKIDEALYQLMELKAESTEAGKF